MTQTSSFSLKIRSTSCLSSKSPNTGSTLDSEEDFNQLEDVIGDADNSQRGDLSALQGDDFMSFLTRSKINSVIRLNESYECKDEAAIISLLNSRGFECSSLPFADGTVPPKKTFDAFVKGCNAGGAVAVHCMQGLGRTGAIVGAYAVGRYNISGTAFHGWSRICRPGTVQTRQQESFLRGLRQKSDVHGHLQPSCGVNCVLQ
jgi:protein-tyrosine phosphatase